MIELKLEPAELAHSPEGFILSGIGAIRRIEHTIAAVFDSGAYAVELDEMGVLESAPDASEVEHAYALELGCPAITTRWRYDYESHQFRAYPPDPYFANRDPLEVPQETRLYLISEAERFRVAVGKAQTLQLRKEAGLPASGAPQASEASPRDVNRCG